MDVVQVARHWFPHAHSFEIESSQPGFSGGRVFRVRPQISPHSFALKVADQASASRWPTTQERIASACAASSTSLLATPQRTADGVWTVVDGPNVWQCSRWLDGQACQDDEAADPENASRMLQLGATAIARVHSQCSVLPPPTSENAELSANPPMPRCMADRIERLGQWHALLSTPDTLSHRLPASMTQWQVALAQSLTGDGDNGQLATLMVLATKLILEKGFEINRRLQIRLAESAQDILQIPLAWALRDVHREHILFDRSRSAVTGVIDHDAMDWDCRIADLARWAGSFPVALDNPSSNQTRHRWRLAVQSYENAARLQKIASHPVEPLADLWTPQPFSACRTYKALTLPEIGLGETLLEVNAWIGLANWVNWIGCRRRIFLTSPTRLFKRISGLIDSVCQFC